MDDIIKISWFNSKKSNRTNPVRYSDWENKKEEENEESIGSPHYRGRAALQRPDGLCRGRYVDRPYGLLARPRVRRHGRRPELLE